MGAIASLSDLVNRMTGGNSGSPENIFMFKNFTIGGVADTWAADIGWYSFWKYDGFPGGGSNPTTVEAPTSATAGAVPFTAPGGGRQKWLIQAGVMGQASTNALPFVMLYDRLLHIGGLDGTNIGAQTVGGSLTRYTTGVGNKIYVEIYTAVGTTARTITATYHNQAGTGSRVTQAVTFGGTAGTVGNDANLFIQLPLQAGDSGVQSVESVTISASTVSAAGNFGVTIVHPLAIMAMPASGTSPVVSDFTTGPGGVPEILTDACLAFAGPATSSTEVVWSGMLCTVEA